ncbi:MAG TPA: DUF2461 family protein [Candidatus Eremiobacteraceae bacterium]|nr:DUF2461 family protein [Candidatus Eremiobacteraceae bacterium]
MPAAPAPFSQETFRFFRELHRNNRKAWMDQNRDRYKESIVQPFRRLLDDLCPGVLRLDLEFDVRGRTGANFSRINRDIRFAKDKTPYKTQMYLKFQRPAPGDRETGQLYVGVSMNAVTAGFRIYSGSRRKDSILAAIAQARVTANPNWVARQKKRLASKYESYWYKTVQGEWTKHEGWPSDVEDWKKLQAWIVRKKMTRSAATKTNFRQQILKIFTDLYPLLKFTSVPD